MPYFIICDNCYKPTEADSINLIQGDERIKRDVQYYCNQCWPSITYQKVQEKHEELRNSKKTITKGNERGAPSRGLFVEKRR